MFERRAVKMACLFAMVLLCAAGAVSGSRHGSHTNSNNNNQGVVGKSRLIKTDSPISQQDQGAAATTTTTMTTIKSLAGTSGERFTLMATVQWSAFSLFLFSLTKIIIKFYKINNSISGTSERRVRKRSKWLQSTTSAGSSPSVNHQGSSSSYFNKDGTFLKRIVTEVIAERDAQIAAALFEVAKNQPHLQMMVQTVRNITIQPLLSDRLSRPNQNDIPRWASLFKKRNK